MDNDRDAVDLKRPKTPREWLPLLPWHLIYALGAIMSIALITLLAFAVHTLSSVI